MRKVNWVKPTLLIVVVAIACFSAFPTSVSLAQTRRSSQGLSWSIIWKWLVGQKVRAGSKSDGDICPIAPGSFDNIPRIPQIWSDRPLFVWKGTAQRITVRPHGSQDILWSQTPTAADQKVTYAGKTLQPGQTYGWVVLSYDQYSRPTWTRSPFQVMETERRDRIATELTALEASLKDKGATAEQIALERANYFKEHQLWYDVLQAAYSVENPSAELSDVLRAVQTEICRVVELNRSYSR